MFDPRHIIVLMLENRSFDHMFGFLPHPDPRFEGLARGASNPAVHPVGTRIPASPCAGKSIEVDPGHHHDEVLEQLSGARTRPPTVINNEGFVASYETKVAQELGAGAGARIMQCQTPGNIPVLSTLALEFAVFDHWFSSVPGATWPNRHFALAGTSDGQVNIKLRPYLNRTVFHALEESGAENPWAVYHEGIPQVWSYIDLLSLNRRKNFKSHRALLDDIAEDRLPSFSFVEPAHFGRKSNSQHPGNNSPKWYRNNPGRDFDAADRLIADIYMALRSNLEVFKKTLFLITYDEHGGFFDHVVPPRGGQWEVAEDDHYVDGAYRFSFDQLGPRVPAVLVSPYINAGTLVQEAYEHSSICATVRRRFANSTPNLSPREQVALGFDQIPTLSTPRDVSNLPSFASANAPPLIANDLRRIPTDALDDFQKSLLEVGKQVQLAIMDERPTDKRFGRARFWPSTPTAVGEFSSVADADSFQTFVVELVRDE
jgi:phospholipase C